MERAQHWPMNSSQYNRDTTRHKEEKPSDNCMLEEKHITGTKSMEERSRRKGEQLIMEKVKRRRNKYHGINRMKKLNRSVANLLKFNTGNVTKDKLQLRVTNYVHDLYRKIQHRIMGRVIAIWKSYYERG